MTTVPTGTSHFAASTVPFMSVYLGVYFAARPHHDGSLRSNAGCALASTAAAAAVELPFDRAKIAITGSVRSAALTSALRVPLGAAPLLAYDQVLSSRWRASRDHA